MDTITHQQLALWRKTATKDWQIKNEPSQQEQILEYYEIAGPDYETWSKNFNMHFGFAHRFSDLFQREKMLNQMSQQVFNRLGLDQAKQPQLIVDLGCGVGASMRYGAENYPEHFFYGCTIVPWQIAKAQSLTAVTKLNNLDFVLSDYTNLPLPDNSVDCVYAIESACYAQGSAKADLIREIMRILKPGGRFVIADGFIRREGFSGFLRKSYQWLCQSWAFRQLANIDEMEKTFEDNGARLQARHDISWRVALSVAHVPFLVLKYLIFSLARKQKLHRQNWNNLISPLMTMRVGLSRKYFGYFLVAGEKK